MGPVRSTSLNNGLNPADELLLRVNQNLPVVQRRTLDLAASALGEPEPIMPMERGGQTVPSRQRLNALAVLAERESRLSALQRLALVDAAASWLSEPNGGEQLAHALLAAACRTDVTVEHAYLALITPLENPADHSEGLPS
jgi:hypothetical protein